MVQWVWTSWNEAFFNAVKWINLTCGGFGVAPRHTPPVMPVPARKRSEDSIAKQHFSVPQRARRCIYGAVDDVIIAGEEIAPAVKEEEEQKEPGNDTKEKLRDFHGYIHDEQNDSR